MRRLVVLVAAVVAAALATPAAAHDAVVNVAVDASHPIGATNRNLVGFGFQPTVQPADFAPLAPRTFRVDASIERLVACPSGTLREDRMADLQRELDGVEPLDAEAIVILSYMPPCLADSYPGDPRDPTRLPPRDPARWHAVVSQVVNALGPGRQAAGKRPVRMFEVWNEPDWIFFQGSQQQFIDNVMVPSGTAVADVAKAHGMDLRFGVCACLFPDPGWMIPLLTAARAHGLPVGFVSWHYYGNYPFIGPDGPEPLFPPQLAPAVAVAGQRNPVTTPDEYRVQTDLVRSWVQGALGAVPELVLDEWNLSAGGFDKRMDTNEGAAFQVATMAAMADAGLDRASLFTSIDPYATDIDGHPLPSRYGGWGVLDRNLHRKPAWYAQWAWSRLGAKRLSSPQDATNGVWTAAGADRERVTVVLASFLATGAHDHQTRVTVSGLRSGRWTARLFPVDATHPGSTTPAATRMVTAHGGRVDVDTPLPSQSVVLVELRRARR